MHTREVVPPRETTCNLYWGNIGIMENKMETRMMQNQMEKQMENEMEILGFGQHLSMEPQPVLKAVDSGGTLSLLASKEARGIEHEHVCRRGLGVVRNPTADSSVLPSPCPLRFEQ